MNCVLVTAPTDEPITVEELKAHSRVTSSAEDALCSQMIKAARLWCESYSKRVFVTQTWDVMFDYSFPCSVIELPKPRLQTITYIKYVAASASNLTLTTLDPAEYQSTASGITGRVSPAYGKTWPSVKQVLDAVQIRIVCGYGSPPAVPENIKQAVYLLAAHFYQNREALIVGSGIDAKEIPLGVRSLLQSGDKLFG